MNKAGVFQAGLLLAVIWLLVRPFGAYLERVFERKETSLDPLLLPVERLIHRTLGVDPKSEMTGKRYSLAFALFGIGNVAFMDVALRWQTALPWFFPQQIQLDPVLSGTLTCIGSDEAFFGVTDRAPDCNIFVGFGHRF
jgi:K+-transporting ATPase A subunit